MSIDMSQFHATFFEEGHEHLDEMERVLMEINLESLQTDDLDTIFRAAHSIKGGSGIFGFDALTSVTHVMESILDMVRSAKMSLSQPLVELLLVTSDQLRATLELYRNKEAIDWEAVGQSIQSLEAWLSGAGESSGVEEGFGFFDSPLLPETDEVYGFFDHPDQESVDEGFGFFEPVMLPLTDASSQPDDDGSKALSDHSALTQHQEMQSTGEMKESASAPPLSRAGKPASDGRNERETSSIRVDIAKVDQLVNLVGELVITQSMLNVVSKDVEGDVAERLDQIMIELERNTRELQETIMSVRMLPVSFVFNRFPRVVRDLSSRLQKSIELVVEGGETEMDKNLIEKLVDPLTHLVRNSIDHGIETPDRRRDLGKPETGRVTLRAVQRGGAIVIEIDDDGAGLNRDRILAKAYEQGLSISPDATDEAVWKLIMEPGFSTAEVVSDVSGRGVGMDVVKRNLEKLGGRIDIHSEAGVGSRFTIQLPLTLAIVDGMGVALADQTFFIPLVSIVESMRPEASIVETLGKNDYLIAVRDRYWPVIPLYKALNMNGNCSHPTEGIVVLIETGRRRFALLVDELIGQQQVVIKSLEHNYKRVPGIAGATIMGDGSVALILDMDALAEDIQQLKYEERSSA